ncbi:MAG: chemotaxis protein CheW [Polyangiaceae bacterium]
MTIANERHFLTFRIAEELYAFDVAKAREIVDLMPITPVPNVPAWIRGIMNLRGAVLPVLDLRQKFGLGRTETTVDTCIIIVDITFADHTYTIGVLADAVRDVFAIESDTIEPPPRLGDSISTDFIEGIGNHGDKFFLILDEQKVFSGAERLVAAGAG